MPENARVLQSLLDAARRLAKATGALQFTPPVACVYNPLEYAWPAHEAYLRRYGGTRKRVIFLGMNPGPFGMAQTGVPFGEVTLVREYLAIEAPVKQPAKLHPKRPVEGFACVRSEVSGARLWGALSQAYPDPRDFFAHGFIANYCPLVFMEASAKNRTPDKLSPAEREALYAACDRHLLALCDALEPELVIGIGKFAEDRARAALPASVRVATILHPSPASPLANRGWAAQALKQLRALGRSGF
jgi:single-strand selective monofunctional uracil DNA glycosylase